MTFEERYKLLAQSLLSSKPLHTGEWQSVDTSKSKLHSTYELLNCTVTHSIPLGRITLQDQIGPSLPWAEEHFGERVSGIPHNPPPSHILWPWARHNENHQDENEQFSHTYPERFWPKWANDKDVPRNPSMHRGIRYRYGDLSDVVNLLVRSPLTRQAYLPVWFPEDTGAHQSQRVPCSLGYHFMIRENKLNITYYIRSCDILRHFRDDVYLACRLAQWMTNTLAARTSERAMFKSIGTNYTIDPLLEPGLLIMHIGSLHAFVGDRWKLEKLIKDG